MTARRIFPAIFMFASVAAVTGAAGAFFRHWAPALAAENVFMMSVFFGALTVMALLPVFAVAGDGVFRRAAGKALIIMLVAVFAGFLPAWGFAPELSLPVLKHWAGAIGIALSFAFFAAGCGYCGASFISGEVLKNRRAGVIIALLCVGIFLLSPWWSGVFLTGADDFAKLFFAWLSPLSLLGAALPGLNFSCLPGIYNIWFGSLCPQAPGIGAAMAAYLIPGVILFGIAQWRKLW